MGGGERRAGIEPEKGRKKREEERRERKRRKGEEEERVCVGADGCRERETSRMERKANDERWAWDVKKTRRANLPGV